jgi:hypothetical protein
VKNNCGSFLDLQTFLHFGNRQDETRDIHWALIQCNKSFSANEEILPSWATEDNFHQMTPAYEVREYASTLYQTLLDKLPGCGKTGHEAKLCLSRYESCEELASEIGFDVLFSTHTPRWQESRIEMIVKTYVYTYFTLPPTDVISQEPKKFGSSQIRHSNKQDFDTQETSHTTRNRGQDVPFDRKYG